MKITTANIHPDEDEKYTAIARFRHGPSERGYVQIGDSSGDTSIGIFGTWDQLHDLAEAIHEALNIEAGR